MSQEQNQYYRNVSAFVILAFGFVGSGVGVFLVWFLSHAGWRDTLAFGLLAALGGFVGGAIAGATVSLLVGSSNVDANVRTESGGPQLVGQLCVICNKTIGSITDGEFCGECRSAVHYKCAECRLQSVATLAVAETACPRCGT
jgi:hypothetical protein